MVLRRNYVMHRLGGDEGGTRPVFAHDLAGPLCTSIDRLGSAVLVPRLDEGCVLAIHAAGAYGPTASPLHFISHPPPAEILLEGGQIRDVTRRFG
jgi:diaminopimelate decarboxylase